MRGKREFLKEFDIFSKVDKSAVPSSTTGGTFSFIVMTIVLFLFLQEFISFGGSEFNEYVSVDKSGNGVMNLAMDISFPHLPCSDIMFNGQTLVGVNHQDVVMYKMAFDRNTPDVVWCQPCDGAHARDCCRCEDVMDAYWALGSPALMQEGQSIPTCYYIHNNQQANGCRVLASLKAPKMKGLLYFLTVQQDHQKPQWDHTITFLSFGKPFPGIQNALSGHVHQQKEKQSQHAQIENKHLYNVEKITYSLVLIPTIYDDLYSAPIYSTQYSASTHTEFLGVTSSQVSGVFFQYDLSPIVVTKEEVNKSLFHLLTRLCAIIGGVWALAGLFYSIFLRHLIRNLERPTAGK